MLTDTHYSFDCNLCGSCCSGDMEIYLLPYDLYKMARFLSIKNTKQLITRGYVTIEEGQNGILLPKIRFKKNPFPFCPFLINDLGEDGVLKGLCSLHPHNKPLVCSLAPLGRVYDFDRSQVEYQYNKPTPECSGCDCQKEHSLSEIEVSLEKEIYYEEEFYKKLFHGFIPTKEFYYFPVEEPFSLSSLKA